MNVKRVYRGSYFAQRGASKKKKKTMYHMTVSHVKEHPKKMVQTNLDAFLQQFKAKQATPPEIFFTNPESKNHSIVPLSTKIRCFDVPLLNSRENDFSVESCMSSKSKKSQIMPPLKLVAKAFSRSCPQMNIEKSPSFFESEHALKQVDDQLFHPKKEAKYLNENDPTEHLPENKSTSQLESKSADTLFFTELTINPSPSSCTRSLKTNCVYLTSPDTSKDEKGLVSMEPPFRDSSKMNRLSLPPTKPSMSAQSVYFENCQLATTNFVSSSVQNEILEPKIRMQKTLSTLSSNGTKREPILIENDKYEDEDEDEEDLSASIDSMGFFSPFHLNELAALFSL
ncbi:uncharacterized protein MONOS_4034 [Monocercomonoides exilis]|uniref:uncharacterized protein n=1 Tax=Monocercomonoides exilis TaxID=2049356 RepID=UPI00355A9B78|nr:hypothetical protein MONOS_4034 [Monocercomonoides exilis]